MFRTEEEMSTQNPTLTASIMRWDQQQMIKFVCEYKLSEITEQTTINNAIYNFLIVSTVQI